jgi:hypothetical protein
LWEILQKKLGLAIFTSLMPAVSFGAETVPCQRTKWTCDGKNPTATPMDILPHCREH